MFWTINIGYCYSVNEKKDRNYLKIKSNELLLKDQQDRITLPLGV